MARFCKHCGAQLSDNAKFCKGCGQAVTAPVSNNAQAQFKGSAQNMQMSVSSVCPNCGNGLRPGAKFCRVCGMASAPNAFTGYSTQNKKKSKMFYPIVALVTVLAIAVVSVGGYFLYDRLISPHVGSGTDMSYPQGNSKAFSITPLEGITISAEKNALKEDTEISLTLKNDEAYYKEYEEPLNELGSEPLVAFDLDMGLEPEEPIPGYVNMTFDLAGMGIPKELWENIEIYRQREEFDETVPEGSFEKYAADLDDKGILSLKTTKNCSIIVTVAAGLGIVIGSGIQYYKYYDETKHFDSDKSITIRNRDKWDYDLTVNLDDTEVPNDGQYKGVMESTQAFSKYTKELYDKAKKAYADELVRKAAEGQNAFTYSWWDEFVRIEEMRKKIDKNLFIKNYFDNDEKFKEMSSKLVIPQSVKKAIEVINDSYEYINSQLIKIPARVVSFYMLPMTDLGLKVSGLTYPSYMQLNSTALVIGGKYMPSGVDGFRLTCTHEFFHICQEEYAFGGYTRKGKEILEDTRFEEATAAVLEKDASYYYYEKGIQKQNPNEGPGGELGYVERNENYCYCYPLNEKPQPEDGEDIRIKIGYTEADLIDYLRDKKKKVSVAALMNVYSKTVPPTHFVDILRDSGAFDIKKDEKWNELFQGFCLDHAKKIADQTKKGEKQYPGYLINSVAVIPGGGFVFNWESSYKNIACVKTIRPDNPNNIKRKYVVILEQSDESAKDGSNMLRLLNDKGEQTWKEKNYTDPVEEDTLILYSRTDSEVPLNFNAICIFEPEAPMIAREGSTVRVTTTTAPANLLKNNKVSALRTKITRNGKEVVNNTPVNSTDPKNQLGQDIYIDISSLGDGADEEFKCTQAWIYKDPKGKEYESPEVEGMFGTSITGTWRFDSLSQYSSELMGGIADLMEKSIPYTGTQMDEYVQKYGDILRGQVGVPGSGKFTIAPGNEKDKYVVTLKYSDSQAPIEVYDAVYDAGTSTITMKPRPRVVTDGSGNSYDLSEYGLQADIVAKIETVEGSKKGEQKLVLNGSSANDQKNIIVAYKVLISGLKISDSIEELK